MFENYSPGVIENSGKFVLLFQIIEETLRLNEKLLVFSQSLMTLNLVEEFLSKMPVPLPWLNETWAKNHTYYSKCFAKRSNELILLFSLGWLSVDNFRRE